jgi:hypothetical protein
MEQLYTQGQYLINALLNVLLISIGMELIQPNVLLAEVIVKPVKIRQYAINAIQATQYSIPTLIKFVFKAVLIITIL